MPVSWRSGNTAYETLNTHEIVTGGRNPISVRSWSGVGQDQVRREWGAFIDGTKVVRIGIIQIN